MFQYVFSLENWVLTGLQGGYTTLNPRSSCELMATCPPYWIMFSSPQESRLASRWSSDFWEPNPRPRSRSLNAAHYRTMNARVKFTISDSEDEEFTEEDADGEAQSKRGGLGLPRQGPGLKDLYTCRSSNFLKLPSPCSLAAQHQGTSSSHCRRNSPKRNLQRSQSSAGRTNASPTISHNNFQSECINNPTPKVRHHLQLLQSASESTLWLWNKVHCRVLEWWRIFVGQPGSLHHPGTLDKNPKGFFNWFLDCCRK